MTEDDEEKSPAYLRAEIATLRHMLEIAISTMRPDAREFISRRMWETQKNYQQMSDEKQTDPLRDKAAILWDTAASLDNLLDENTFEELRSD